MHYELFIFDIDGTLVDSGDVWAPAVQKAIREVYQQHGITTAVPTLQEIRPVIGIPGPEAIKPLVPPEHLKLYPEISKLIGLYGTQQMNDGNGYLFDGVLETFKQLKAQGSWIALASNCGKSYLREVQDRMGIGEYVDLPLCLDTPKVGNKSDMVTLALETFQTRRAVMVGDRHLDLDAAHDNGIPFLAFHGGFGHGGEWPEAEGSIHSYDEFFPTLSTRKKLLGDLAEQHFQGAAKKAFGISGLPSSGKTQFTEEWARVCREKKIPIRLVAVEEFRRPDTRELDYRQLAENLKPSRDGEIVLVEGPELWSREIHRHLNALLFLQVSPEIALRRYSGRTRAGSNASFIDKFKQQFEAQQKQLQELSPRFDLILDNSNLFKPVIQS